MNTRYIPLVIFFALALVLGIYLTFNVTVPRIDRSKQICNKLFTEFMSTKDPIILHRNAWLIYKMDCKVFKRYEEYTK